MSVLIAGRGALAAGIERSLSKMAVARLASAAEQSEAALATALQGASVLVLAADDDGGNVDLALQVRRLRPELALVARIFDAALAAYLAQTVPGMTVLSMSAVAAPEFAAAARRCLADAAAGTAHDANVSPHAAPRRRFRVDRVLVTALACLFLLVFPSALFFAHALDLRYMDALYFVWTTVMTVGYGDIALKDASDGVKLYGMALMLAGASFIAVLFALLSDWVLSRRLDLLRGRTAERGKGHLIIAGAGNIGFRLAALLVDAGRRLVIIERDAESRNAAALAAAGHHVIIGDATLEDLLDLAGLRAAALLLAVTDSDAANLQLALHAGRHGVPVIMRADSAELAAHVTRRGDAAAVAPVEIASRAFAEAVARSTSR